MPGKTKQAKTTNIRTIQEQSEQQKETIDQTCKEKQETERQGTKERAEKEATYSSSAMLRS